SRAQAFCQKIQPLRRTSFHSWRPRKTECQRPRLQLALLVPHSEPQQHSLLVRRPYGATCDSCGQIPKALLALVWCKQCPSQWIGRSKSLSAERDIQNQRREAMA